MADAPQLLAAIPVLPALDIPTALDFYREKLGFPAAFEYPDYAGVARGAIQIHLWRCGDPRIPQQTSCRVIVSGVDDLYEECRSQDVVHPNGAIADKPWGFREFTVVDSCGNAIVFAESLATT